VPAEAAPRVDGLVDALEAEAGRPPDRRTADLERHLVGALLLWVERWYDDARIERPASDDADVQLHRRFAQVLERDYATHHDAAHYADALAVPQDALARALGRAAGRSTKELVIDRAILEAARLLRYEDLSVQAVARRVGFTDPFHFSRTFKRRRGESPAAYRARVRGP
jgi:AraC family transcriptional activator of pobA